MPVLSLLEVKLPLREELFWSDRRLSRIDWLSVNVAAAPVPLADCDEELELVEEAFEEEFKLIEIELELEEMESISDILPPSGEFTA